MRASGKFGCLLCGTGAHHKSPVSDCAKSTSACRRRRSKLLGSGGEAASSNKIDAEKYVGKIAGRAKAHIDSGKVVDREPQIEALVQPMSQKGLLTLVLGGKNLGKTLLKDEAIHRCADRKDKINVLSVDMRDASLAGRPLMAALDSQRQKSLTWTTRAKQGLRAVIAPAVSKAIATEAGEAAKGVLDVVMQEKQINIENFINQTVRSGRIPSIVVDEANLALPGISGEANTAAKTALATITKWTKQTKQANFMLISSEFGNPFRLLECSLNLQGHRQGDRHRRRAEG